MRQEHRKRVGRGKRDHYAIRRHHFATLIAKLIFVFFDHNIADARVRANGNILDQRIGQHRHTAFEIRPVRHLDLMRRLNGAAIETEHRRWKRQCMLQHTTLDRYGAEQRAGVRF